MKIVIKNEKFILDHMIKAKEGEYSLHLLRKEGDVKHHLLAIYRDYYKLYRPLGNSLPVTKEPLIDIQFSMEKR